MPHRDAIPSNSYRSGHTDQAVVIDDSIAIRPNDPHAVSDLLKQIVIQGFSFNADAGAASPTRISLLDAARSLVYALETPREAMIRHCWSESTAYAAIETSIGLGLFKALAQREQSMSATELAHATGAEPVFLARILKHLAAMGVIKETGADEYCSTGFSKTMSIERFSDAYPCITGCIAAGCLALPEYLRKNGYRNPSDGHDTPFQLGFRTDQHFFEYLQANPVIAGQFSNHMSAYRQGRPSWMDIGFYPVKERLLGESKFGSDDILLVDVGGSLGHDLSEFRQKWPQVPGRLILQDLPAVTEGAKGLDTTIEVMAHDFFTEQPVKGARAYYMHSVLHDWTDDNCRKILTNLKNAMKPGYSKILINENVIPDTNAYWETTSLDILMMSNFASQERTARQWHALVESVGLKVVQIYTVQRGVESLIECELA
ncbi:hypothetical protein ASPZODRAFT_169288 [Penicilliopsis zonata CBS 506.65]|uniref:Uncharacterized protein n=1 Tax=Penicilliopsis zonata CBS 506.65 TaxID=1073090 RepID=A0A1L9S8Y2_9EURO|nr:hypothetical protein ASPZODRAFT_169288 [Penicilliopsis zonata CBS 506.65]OJJ43620.1 hypothetical protein ASPZODRAFT_169288 [Penicilliopsis zonata CBS 506.65]